MGNMILLASFNLSIYGNILLEQMREISFISNTKMFFNYNISDHGDDVTTQQTRGIKPVLILCWASVADGGPELDQHWVNVSCLLGSRRRIIFSMRSLL